MPSSAGKKRSARGQLRRRASALPPRAAAALPCRASCCCYARRLLSFPTRRSSDLARLEVTGVAVRDLSRDRRPNVPAELLTADASALVRQADLVIEVMGGIEPARSLLLEAMSHGASVVTANKALLAQDGAALYEAADTHGVDLYFEAAVAGAIPLVRPVRE